MHSEIWKEVSICCSGFIIHDADCLTGCKVAGFSATEQMSFSDLSYSELQSLCFTEDYPSDSFTFTAHGCELRIDNEQVAEVFAELSPTEQSILILRFVMDMTDKEVGVVLGMSRCAVQRRRTKTLDKMRDRLKTLLPKGG